MNVHISDQSVRLGNARYENVRELGRELGQRRKRKVFTSERIRESSTGAGAEEEAREMRARALCASSLPLATIGMNMSEN